MLLSALYVYFRDIQPIWEVVNPRRLVLRLPRSIVPLSTVQAKLSPTLVRTSTCSTRWPPRCSSSGTRSSTPYADSASYAMGGAKWLAVPIVISLLIFVLGFWVFNRVAPRVAEDL